MFLNELKRELKREFLSCVCVCSLVIIVVIFKNIDRTEDGKGNTPLAIALSLQNTDVCALCA